MTSSFSSAVPLGGHVRKSETPGVGAYNPHGSELLKSPSEGSCAFAGSSGKSRSLGQRSTTGETVGPGSYDVERGTIKQKMEAKTNPRLPGFASSSVRGEAYD